MVVAIFLLVALAALGAFIANITSSQQIGGAYDLQGAHAYQAARYGSEWGVYQVLQTPCAAGSFCADCRAATYATPHGANIGGLADALAPYTVSVRCASGGASHAEGGQTVWVYQITATACNAPNAGACPNETPAVSGLGYIERRIALTVTN